SEGLLFKHFPTKSALYAEILAEECAADPELHRLLELEPSTETLVVLIREMVRHFQEVQAMPDQQEAQRLRLMLASHLDDGEFARLVYDKIGGLIGPVFDASLKRAIDAGDPKPVGREPMNLLRRAHHTAKAPIPNDSFANLSSAASASTTQRLLITSTARLLRILGSR